MDLRTAAPFLSDSQRGILITLKSNGRPQASNIVYRYTGGVARVSVTTSRAKTRNLRRDPRASLHVTSSDFWKFVVADGTVELSDVTTVPGDEAGQALLSLYNSISPSPHPDPDEFFAAMVEEQRLVVNLHVDHVYGQLPA